MRNTDHITRIRKLIRHLTLALVGATFAAFLHPAAAARGDLDLSFNPSVNGSIRELAVQADGKILIAGVFTEVGGMARSSLARLHADGTLDQGFNPHVGTSNASVAISSMAVQADEKILIWGFFSSVGGVARTNIARLNADGSLDLGFNPVVDRSPLRRLERFAQQSDGKILIAGSFTLVNGVARNSLARLHADGALDMDFHPLAEPGNEFNIYDMALQPDGKILAFLIGGIGTGGTGWTGYDDFVRLNADGTVDPGFNVEADDEIEVVALQPDGKILIGGDFSAVGGVPRDHLARLNADGTPDLTFIPGAYGLSYIIAAQADGKILIGGALIGSSLQQLNANGSLDPAFNANVNETVHDIEIQADGKILISGMFTSVNGVPRPGFARLLGQPANEVSLGRLSVVNGLPGFDIASVTARTVVVEASTNLVNWMGIQSIPIASEPVRFTDTNHASFPSRFYRASWQP